MFLLFVEDAHVVVRNVQPTWQGGNKSETLNTCGPKPMRQDTATPRRLSLFPDHAVAVLAKAQVSAPADAPGVLDLPLTTVAVVRSFS